MNIDNQLKQMQYYIAKILDSTGEFKTIDPGYAFKSAEEALHQDAKRHIFCEQKPEYSGRSEPRKFLILTHADEMPGQLFARKLEAASRQGIYTANVLYRYINSTKDESTKGPLFRRFVLDEDRKEGDVAYHKKAAFNRDSLSHYSHEQQNNFRILRRIEKDWVNAVSAGLPVYYQPKSAELPEMLKRYSFDDILFKGVDHFGNKRQEISKEIKDPKLVEDLNLFTLHSMIRPTNSAQVKYSLSKTIKEGKHNLRFSPASNNLLIADFIPIPKIEVSNDLERIVRHNVGLVDHAKKHRLSEDILYNLIERIGMQTDSWDRDNSLLSALNAILKIENPASKEEDIEMPKHFSIKKITVGSRSNPDQVHYITETRNLETGGLRYNCSCEGYKFRKECSHVDKIEEGNKEDVISSEDI